jgi:hypothetical protein
MKHAKQIEEEDTMTDKDQFKQKFNARKYLEFYWPEDKLDVEDMFIMRFLHKTCLLYKTFLQGKVWLELSGGPVIDKYISASKYVKEIYHTAYTSSSIDEVQNFIKNNSIQYDWSKRFEFVHQLEKEEGTGSASNSIAVNNNNYRNVNNKEYKVLEARLRDKINNNVLYCDLRNNNKCGIIFENSNGGGGRDNKNKSMDNTTHEALADVLSIHSVVECISKTSDECFALLENALKLLKAGGLLIMTMNLETNHWNNSDTLLYEAANVNAEEILKYLNDFGFYNIQHELFIRDADDEITNMEKTLAFSCRLK